MNLQWTDWNEREFRERIFFVIIFLPVCTFVHLVLNDIEKKKEENMGFFSGKNLLYTAILYARENFCLIKN